ncbi:hypothetical protein EMCRGX_G028661 [Ephydatia muelleri]
MIDVSFDIFFTDNSQENIVQDVMKNIDSKSVQETPGNKSQPDDDELKPRQLIDRDSHTAQETPADKISHGAGNEGNDGQPQLHSANVKLESRQPSVPEMQAANGNARRGSEVKSDAVHHVDNEVVPKMDVAAEPSGQPDSNNYNPDSGLNTYHHSATASSFAYDPDAYNEWMPSPLKPKIIT